MNDRTPQPGTVVIERFMDDEHSAIVSRGDFGEIFRAWRAHAQAHEIDRPDGLSEVMMRQGLAAGALHLATRRRGEEVAWTLNLKLPPTNIFVSGDNTTRSITGRAYVRDVAIAETSRLFVETRRGDTSFRSVIEVEGLDVVDIFNRYYSQSEQKRARFFELSETEFLLVFGLPTAPAEWVESIDLERAKRLDTKALGPLGTEVYTFRCDCDPQRMRVAVRAIFKDRVEELFLEDDHVMLACPRCGRRWRLGREDFYSDPDGVQAGPKPA